MAVSCFCFFGSFRRVRGVSFLGDYFNTFWSVGEFFITGGRDGCVVRM